MANSQKKSDIENFRSFAVRKMLDLYSCIPSNLKYEEVDKKLDASKYANDYRATRDKIIVSLLTEEELIIGSYENEKRQIEKRKEQHKILSELFLKISKEVEWRLSTLEENITNAQKCSKYKPEQLLRNTSLVEEIDELKPVSGAEGYIYLIREHYSHRYKIGKSQNIKQRAAVFGVTLPFTWHFIAIYLVTDVSYMEKRLHQIFKSKRACGEWFDLDPEDLFLLFEIMTGKSKSDAVKKCEKVEDVVTRAEEKVLEVISKKHSDAVLSSLEESEIRNITMTFLQSND